jgi:hypothetical protein
MILVPSGIKPAMQATLDGQSRHALGFGAIAVQLFLCKIKLDCLGAPAWTTTGFVWFTFYETTLLAVIDVQLLTVYSNNVVGTMFKVNSDTQGPPTATQAYSRVGAVRAESQLVVSKINHVITQIHHGRHPSAPRSSRQRRCRRH